jgi:hypothetical protein
MPNIGPALMVRAAQEIPQLQEKVCEKISKIEHTKFERHNNSSRELTIF